MKRQPGWKRLVYIAVSVTIGLVLAEVLVRAYARVGGEGGRRLAARDPSAVLYEPFGNFGYRQKPGLHEQYGNGTRAVWNSMGYRGPLVSVEKPSGTYRVVLLGESTTHGYGVNNDHTIDAYMRDLLRKRFERLRFEVVNLALGGYDSYQIYERMRVDATRLSPDLVVINAGINDVRNAQFDRLIGPPDPRTLIWEADMRRMREEAEHGSRLSTVLQHYSHLARMPGFLAELWRQRQTLEETRVATPFDAAVDYFDVNVSRTTQLALGTGASVLLSTPPSAITASRWRSDRPEKSYWIRDAATTDGYRRRLADRMKAIADRQRALGKNVQYISHELPTDYFLDDAHLTSEGNRMVARDFAEAAVPFVQTALVAAPAVTRAHDRTAAAPVATARPLPR